MEFEVLGPVRIRQGGEPRQLTGRMQRTLLGLLLARANRPVPADVLIDALWQGERVDGGARRLQVSVHRLRKSLDEPDRLMFAPAGYQLRVAAGELDSEHFEGLVERAESTTDPRTRAALLREGLDLWRGPAYEGIDVESLVAEAHRLEDLHQSATESLFEAELARGRHAAVLPDLADLVRRAPLRERPQALLVRALHRSGRRAEALQAYQDARTVLAEELGLDPGPELRAAEAQVLTDDAAVENLGPTDRPVPRQVPNTASGFVGRQSALAELDRLLDEEHTSSPVVLVTGTAGVGKSTLAAQWAHRVRDHFPDGQLWVDLQGYGPHPPLRSHDVLATFLRALGVSGPEMPTEPSERVAAFRSLTDALHLLVVLDNASTAEQVRPLLPSGSSCMVVITGRDILSGLVARDGARRLDLDRLSVAEALELLEELLGPEQLAGAGRSSVHALAEHCARLPLALRIAAELLRGPPQRGVDELVADLADEHRRVALLQLADDPYSAVPVVFSWSYQQLSPDAALMFRRFGLHPGASSTPAALAAMADLAPARARRALDVLVRAHLVEVVDGRHRMHDLLHAYAAELAESTDPDAERSAAVDRMVQHHLALATAAMDLIAPHEEHLRPSVRPAAPPEDLPADADAATAWLEAERTTLLDLAEHAAADHQVIALSGVLWRHLLDGSHLPEAIALHTRALAAARRLGDRRAEADVHRYLAGIWYRRTEHDRAEAECRNALARYRELGDHRLHAAALNTLASIQEMSGHYPAAMRNFRRVAALYEDSGDEADVAWMQGNLGKLHLRLGHHDRARTLLEGSLRASREHGFPDEYRSRALRLLAVLHRRAGDLDRAAAYARDAVELSRSCGARAVEACSLVQQGSVERQRGDLAAAVSTLDRAVELARRAGDRFYVAEALNRLGRAHRSADDPIRAMRAHREALTFAELSGSRLEQANARCGLGDAYCAIGDDRRGDDHRERALALYDELGVPEAAMVRARLREVDSPVRS